MLRTACTTPASRQDVLRTFRENTGLDLHMRVGIHIGAVAYGVIGTTSPRFCELFLRLACFPLFKSSIDSRAGILGEATAIAEATQTHGAPDTISCSAAAREAYLASAYAFQPISVARSPGDRAIESFAVTFAAASQPPLSPSSSDTIDV